MQKAVSCFSEYYATSSRYQQDFSNVVVRTQEITCWIIYVCVCVCVWLNGITNSTDMNLSKIWKMVKDREAWNAVVGHDQVTEQNVCVCFCPYDETD